jgi:2-oxoglutarate ferredoxin oxidoreductase subunit beta
LVHGEPIRFGAEGSHGVRRNPDTQLLEIVEVAAVGEDALLVHDAHCDDPSTAFALSRLTGTGHLDRAPVGIFRQVDRPTYDDDARAQVAFAATDDPQNLDGLLRGADTWTVN